MERDRAGRAAGKIRRIDASGSAGYQSLWAKAHVLLGVVRDLEGTRGKKDTATGVLSLHSTRLLYYNAYSRSSN